MLRAVIVASVVAVIFLHASIQISRPPFSDPIVFDPFDSTPSERARACEEAIGAVTTATTKKENGG
jgi:hypothetical protein